MSIILPNSVMLNVTRGESVSARVRAVSSTAQGEWSWRVRIIVAGTPSPVQNLASAELSDGVQVTWATPLDTGSGDQSVAITTSTVWASLCVDFASSEDCGTLSVDVDGSSTSYTFTASDLVTSSQYFFIASASNAVGQSAGFSSTAASDFRVAPAIQVPASFPVFVVVHNGAVHVWLDSARSSSLTLVVGGLPASLDTTSGFTSSGAGHVSATKSSDRVWTLSFTPSNQPACNTLPCETQVEISPSQFPDKVISFALIYTSYPAPTVNSIFPASGSEFGGTGLVLSLTDFGAGITRASAGLPNLIDAVADQNISVTFVGACGTRAFATAVEARFNSGTGAAGEVLVDVTVQTPASLCGGEATASVVLSVRNQELQLASTISFRYINAGMSVSPDSGMSYVGGSDLSLTVLLNNIGALSFPSVTLGDVAGE
eukprot:3937319-Rhodomonas_salina.1